MRNDKISIAGMITGAIFAVVTHFILTLLTALLFCSGLCDSPGFVMGFWSRLGISLLLGAIAGNAMYRKAQDPMSARLIGAAFTGLLVGSLLICAAVII